MREGRRQRDGEASSWKRKRQGSRPAGVAQPKFQSKPACGASGRLLAVVVMPLPVVVILCPKEFTFSDPAAAIERRVLDGVAEVQTIAMDFNEPLPAAALAADALLLWHNIPVGADVIAKLTKCRALIRN